MKKEITAILMAAALTVSLAACAGSNTESAVTESSAADSVDRMVNVFPEGQQRQIRLQLSTTLRAVLSQQLLPKRAGGGVRSHDGEQRHQKFNPRGQDPAD